MDGWHQHDSWMWHGGYGWAGWLFVTIVGIVFVALVVTMVMLAGPMVLLFELGLVAARIASRPRMAPTREVAT